MSILPSHLFSLNVVNTRAAQWASSTTLLWIIISIGILFRTAQYLANRSLWGDEASVALDVIYKSPLQLFYRSATTQPPGFLIIEKLTTHALGTSEYALRLFPLLSGIISLFLFYRVAKLFISPKALPIALGLFALSDRLIYYSSEVKQYSSDTAITLFLYLLVIRYLEPRKFTVWHSVFLGAISSIVLWFSHSSLFVLVGLGLSLVLHWYLVEREWRKISQFAVACLLLALSFSALYYIHLRHLSGSVGLLSFWEYSFMPFPPLSFLDIRWFISTFFRTFLTPVGLFLPGIAALAFIVGSYSLYREMKEKFFLLISPILVTLLASAFHKYPFSGRVLLFIVPSVLILIAEGVQQIIDITKYERPIIGITLTALLFLHPLLSASYHLIRPRGIEEIKPVLNYVREHLQDGDVLYVHRRASLAFKYYKEKYGFTDNDYIVGKSGYGDWGIYISDLDQLRGRRVWMIFSHWSAAKREVHRGQIVGEETFFIYQLDKIGTMLDSFKSSGSASYLYDIRG